MSELKEKAMEIWFGAQKIATGIDVLELLKMVDETDFDDLTKMNLTMKIRLETDRRLV